MWAPMARSGSTTRPIGRVTSDSSPVSTVRNAAGEETGEQADARPRVPAVDDVAGFGERVDAVAVDHDAIGVGRDGHPERLDGEARSADVVAARETLET